MVTTRSQSSLKQSPRRRDGTRGALFGGLYIPNEVLMLILDILEFEDRASLAAVCSQFRPLALKTIDKLKVMKELPYCAPAPASISAPGWVMHRIATPSRNLARFQNVMVRCSSVLTYLNLLGTNLLSQDVMSWIYHIDLPVLENIKFPNGTDLYICLLRDLAENPRKWPLLTQISVGFGSKLEVPEECLELVRRMRYYRQQLKSNIARCRECLRLYFTDSRVKCLMCGHTICSQHFTRAAGNHCRLSLRIKCPYSGLKYHTDCAREHSRTGCTPLSPAGHHWPCYISQPVVPKRPLSIHELVSDQGQGSDSMLVQ